MRHDDGVRPVEVIESTKAWGPFGYDYFGTSRGAIESTNTWANMPSIIATQAIAMSWAGVTLLNPDILTGELNEETNQCDKACDCIRR
jgi:hypothetical protein